MINYEHDPVLKEEILQWINPKTKGRYLDGTIGLGGHTLALLEATKGSIQVLGIDKDRKSLAWAERRIIEAGYKEQVNFAHCAFSRFPKVFNEMGWDFVDGVLLDLGLSSFQLQDLDRGFSFLRDAPLDMRMDIEGGQEPVRNLVNYASWARLKYIIRRYGEDPLAGRIANMIIKERAKKKITTTSELAEIVYKAYPPAKRFKAKNHPATRTFMALRIAVNYELQELEDFLKNVPAYLRSGARIAVISFHSLEDRIVKQAFRVGAKDCLCARLRILTKKPIVPSAEEIKRNIRSRSAKLRVAEAM